MAVNYNPGHAFLKKNFTIFKNILTKCFKNDIIILHKMKASHHLRVSWLFRREVNYEYWKFVDRKAEQKNRQS